VISIYQRKKEEEEKLKPSCEIQQIVQAHSQMKQEESSNPRENHVEEKKVKTWPKRHYLDS